MQSRKVKFYCWTWCPYCTKAKELLMKKNIDFEEIVIDDDRLAMEKLTAQTGSGTVPQIFVEDLFIGGCDEIFQLEEKGDFDAVFFTDIHENEQSRSK